MNKQQLKKSLGYYVRLRPPAVRSNGQVVDEDWVIASFPDEDTLELTNRSAGTSALVGMDGVFGFTREPNRQVDGNRYGVLQLNVEIRLRADGSVELEPLPHPRAANRPVTYKPRNLPRQQEPSRKEWRRLQTRLQKYTDDFDVEWRINKDGSLQWILPPYKDRRDERFKGDAAEAGSMAKRAGYLPQRLNPTDENAPEDFWFAVLASRTRAIAYNSENDGWLKRAVETSKTVCTMFAAESKQ